MRHAVAPGDSFATPTPDRGNLDCSDNENLLIQLNSAKIGDRAIAAVIAGIMGYFVGLLLAFFVKIVFGNEYGIRWLVFGGFSLYGFLAPVRSRELWTSIWAAIVRFYGRLFGWRG